MKLPSINYLALSARQSLLRFPFTMLSALIAVTIGIYLTEKDAIPNPFLFINIMLCAGLGISLFFCVDVFADNKGFSKKNKWLLELLAMLVLVILYFTLPDAESTQNTSLPYIRYGIYSVTIHLLVAFVPFLGVGQLNGFWHYNKILFVRFLTSMLYAAFLYAGLALALGSLDFLFDIDLHNKLFMDLFIVIAVFFNTWFFISGIPEKFDALDKISEYPKGIKIFSQYVLLPLLILYLIILYSYASKIVILWSWPKGIVSYLIACVAVLGILTLLLIHPYGNLPGNTWIKKFSKLYYFILFPLVILLFIAIGMRVADYGVTINRYSIILLGSWLTLVCIYFAVGKTNIKFIPISLGILLIIISFGYWGIFAVSERSQVARLKTILEKAKILESGKIKGQVTWRMDTVISVRHKPAQLQYVKGSMHTEDTMVAEADTIVELKAVQTANTNEGLLNDSLHNEVKSILDYLDDHHGFAAIREWYRDVDDIIKLAHSKRKKRNRFSEPEIYMKSMGLKYEHKYRSSHTPYFSYSVNSNKDVVEISNYDYLVKFHENDFGSTAHKTDSFLINGLAYTVTYPLLLNDKFMLTTKYDTITFNTNEVINRLLSDYAHDYKSDIPGPEMRLFGSNNRVDVKIQLHSIAFEGRNDSLQVNSISGNLFIKQKAGIK